MKVTIVTGGHGPVKSRGIESLMKWSEIRRQYPDKFILLGDIVEEKISDTKYRIIAGTILKVSDDAQEIRRLYQDHKQKGDKVIYALPITPLDFIVENVLFMGLLR